MSGLGVGDDTTRRTSVLQMTGNRPNGLAALIATASLFGVFMGHVQAAVPSAPLSESIGPRAGDVNLERRNILLAAAPVPKISVPQVHVNVGTHARLPKISEPRVHVNVGAHVNTGSVKGKVTAGNSGTGEGAAIRSLSFTHIQVEYKPQSDNGSPAKSGTGQNK